MPDHLIVRHIYTKYILCLDNSTIAVGNNNRMYLSMMWLRATIEALSSIFSCFVAQWKHVYSTSCLAERWTLMALWQTVWAVISCWQLPPLPQKQLNFLHSVTQINLIWGRQHLLVLKNIRALIQHFPSFWPFAFLWPEIILQTLVLTWAMGKASVSHYKLQGDVFTVVWMEKQNVIHVDKSKWTRTIVRV